MTDPEEKFTARDRTRREATESEAWGKRLEELGHLYRYTTVAGDGMKWLRNLVLKSEMFFTPFTSLNDPFDGAVQLVVDDATGEQIRDYWTEWLAESGTDPTPEQLERIEYFVEHANDPVEHARVRRSDEEEMAKLGVRCFSELSDDLPMWSYYADSHRGVCLRFRAPLLMGWGGIPPIPVTYSDEYPRVSFYRDTRFSHIRARVATKAKVWCHEREWRMVRAHGRMNFPPAALDGLIMGCRIEPKDEAQVRALVVQRRGLLLFRARRAESKFKLEIDPA